MTAKELYEQIKSLHYITIAADGQPIVKYVALKDIEKLLKMGES